VAVPGYGTVLIVVVPAGKVVFVVPVPKVSVKIGSPEFPLQNPNCASILSEDKKAQNIRIILRVLKFFFTFNK